MTRFAHMASAADTGVSAVLRLGGLLDEVGAHGRAPLLYGAFAHATCDEVRPHSFTTMPIEKSASSGKLAAIIVNRNGGRLVLDCVHSLLESSRPPDLVLVVDNNSTDASEGEIQKLFPNIRVLRAARNLGYAAALNLGIEEACRQGSSQLLLMNNDVIVHPEAVAILLQHWDSRAGLLGPKVFRLDDKSRLDAAWGRILFNHVACRMVGENSPDAPQFQRTRGVDALLGCMLLTSCAVVHEVGLLDPDYFMYLEEVDFAYRIRRAGRKALFVADASVWHAGGHSTDPEARRAVKTFYVRRNAVLFLRKHGSALNWCKFLFCSLASLLFFLVTLRWNGFRLRLRGYREGFRVRLDAAKMDRISA